MDNSPVWGPHPAVIAAGVVVTAVAGVAAVLARGSEDRLVAGVVAVIAAVSAFALLRIRRRLAVSAAGVIVGGVFGTRIVPWATVRSIQAVSRRRLGTLSTALEIDLMNDDLLVFSKLDLGVDPSTVADELRRWRHPG